MELGYNQMYNWKCKLPKSPQLIKNFDYIALMCDLD